MEFIRVLFRSSDPPPPDYATYLGIPHVPGAGDLTILLGAIIGAGLAFLWFNAPPAAVFLGDTGRLSLGDRNSVVEGTRVSVSVDFCVRRRINKNKTYKTEMIHSVKHATS